MSRAVPLDHPFDRNKFAELLKQAQGDRPQNRFAEDIGMSKTYLNSYLGAKADKPLTPSTIRKIATVSQNGVTYDDLLNASGYNPEKQRLPRIDIKSIVDMEHDVDKEFDNLVARENSFLGIITTALANKGYKWSGKALKADTFNIAVNLFDLDIDSWYFIFLGESTKSSRVNYSTLYSYGIQLLVSLKPHDKVSFVTDKEEDYERLLKQELPVSLIYASAILIDTDNLAIRKEHFIKTACEYSKKIPTLL